MESDQLIGIVDAAILAHDKAPTRRKPDGLSEVVSGKFNGSLVKVQEDKLPKQGKTREKKQNKVSRHGADFGRA
jgi:hypothetical protein